MTGNSRGRRGRRPRPAGAFVAAVLTVTAIGIAGCSPAKFPSATGATTTVSAAPSTTGPLDARLIATISIDNPDALVEVGGAVWVKTDDGGVVRIDPSTDEVTGTAHVDTATDPSNYCQGIGTDGTAVWACTASDSATGIVRIDPATMATGVPVAVDKVFDQLSLPHTSRGIWVLTADGTAVTVVDPMSQETTSYPLPARCLQLAASEEVVVATCAVDNLVVALDAETGSVRARASLDAPRIAVATDHDVWVDTVHGVTRLSTDLEVRAVYPDQVVGLEGDLAIAGDEVWVRGAGGVLWRIDPTRNTVAEQLSPRAALSAGSLLVTTDAVWASANNDGAVLHLRRAG
jgi:streptogramin lyase